MTDEHLQTCISLCCNFVKDFILSMDTLLKQEEICNSCYLKLKFLKMQDQLLNKKEEVNASPGERRKVLQPPLPCLTRQSVCAQFRTKVFAFAHGLQKFAEKSPEVEVTPKEVLQARKLLSRAKNNNKANLFALLFYPFSLFPNMHIALSALPIVPTSLPCVTPLLKSLF